MAPATEPRYDPRPGHDGGSGDPAGPLHDVPEPLLSRCQIMGTEVAVEEGERAGESSQLYVGQGEEPPVQGRYMMVGSCGELGRV